MNLTENEILILCTEAQQLMQKLPVEVAVRAVGQMPDKVWSSNCEWWTKFYMIVASCYSTEIGVDSWVEVNELLKRLKG